MISNKLQTCFFAILLVLISCSGHAVQLDVTSYDKSHMEIVESGFKQFKQSFLNSSDKQKKSLLYCLERYVDPYYSSQIDYEKALYDWLLTLLDSNESVPVKEHALDVLLWDDSRDFYDCEIAADGKLKCHVQ